MVKLEDEADAATAQRRNGGVIQSGNVNPAFLLRRGELLDLVRNRFTVVAFEQGQVDSPRPAVVQRICLTRRVSTLLPAPI